jgi:hypothetical protein
MAIPGQTINITDPGLGLTEPAGTVALYLGCSELGTVDTVYSFSGKQAALDTLGQGPLTEAVCTSLDIAGGPVLAVRLTGGTAASSGAVTSTRVSTSTGTVVVTVGTAFDAYEVIVEVLSTGGVGIGTFKYSLDDGRTYSAQITIPSGGAYVIASSGLTITFADNAGPVLFEKGDKFEFDTVAPLYTTTNLGTGMAAVLASALNWNFAVLTGQSASTSDGATMFAAFDTHLTTFETNFRYVGGMMDAGIDSTANAITDYAAVADSRILVSYGRTDKTSSKPIVGYGTPKQPLVNSIAARAADSLISTDLARFPDGPMTGVVELEHDERQTEVLDQHGFATSRTFVGVPGFYIANGRIKAPLGSDFQHWQYRRVMDVACDTVYKAQLPFLNTGVRTNADGSIQEADAVRIEETVKNALEIALKDPKNAEGSAGHVSAFSYTVDRTNNVVSSSTILTDVAIRPLGYAKFITTTIGFAVNVG